MVKFLFKSHDNLEKILELCEKESNPLSLSNDPSHIFQNPYNRNFVDDPKDTLSPLSGILRESINFLGRGLRRVGVAFDMPYQDSKQC